MDRQDSLFDVVFHDQALGITFTPDKDDLGAVVDGFYRMEDVVLEAEMGRIIALNDRLKAIQGKSVDMMPFKSVLQTLRTKKRPIRLTFERMKEYSAPEVSWNEVLSHVTHLNIYLSFLQRKGLFLSSKWLTFVIDIDQILKMQSEEKAEFINQLWNDYVEENGSMTSFMYYNNDSSSSLSDSEKIFYLSNMKVEMRDRIHRISWAGFTQSPEYY